MGTIFPKTERSTASGQGMRNNKIATGIAPRNSTMGSIEIKTTIIQGAQPRPLSQLAALVPVEACNSEIRSSNNIKGISFL